MFRQSCRCYINPVISEKFINLLVCFKCSKIKKPGAYFPLASFLSNGMQRIAAWWYAFELRWVLADTVPSEKVLHPKVSPALTPGREGRDPTASATGIRGCQLPVPRCTSPTSPGMIGSRAISGQRWQVGVPARNPQEQTLPDTLC